MTQPPGPRTELRSPLELVNEMDRVLSFSKRGTKAVNDLRKEFLIAKLAYVQAAETRRLDLRREDPKLSQADRDSRARLDNWDLYLAMTQAESEFQYGRDKLNDLERELSKIQTESKLVMAELNLSR